MIEEAIDRFIKDINKITKGSLKTLIIHGSFVLDDYRPWLSDLDFMVILNRRPGSIEAEELLKLKQAYRKDSNHHLAVLEGEFVSYEDINTNEFKRVVYWGTSGQRITNSCGTLNGFNLKNIKENGYIAYGEDIRQELRNPSYEEMLEETIHWWNTLKDYYKPAYKPNNIGWILIVARGISWLDTNRIMSKTESAKWAIKNLSESWVDVLPRVIEARKTPQIMNNEEVLKELIDKLEEPTKQATISLGIRLKK